MTPFPDTGYRVRASQEGILGVEEAEYKARLVSKGYSQILGIDFTDVFSLVVKHRSL